MKIPEKFSSMMLIIKQYSKSKYVDRPDETVSIFSHFAFMSVEAAVRYLESCFQPGQVEHRAEEFVVDYPEVRHVFKIEQLRIYENEE